MDRSNCRVMCCLSVLLAIPLIAQAEATNAASSNALLSSSATLLKQFDRDAWSARSAHEQAVKLGKQVLPDLIVAAEEQSRPEYSRLWLATAVADIEDKKAADALIALLGDRLETVRSVVAYYGPKQKSQELDRAIVHKAAQGTDASLIAYALLGFMVFRETVPDERVKAGLESDNSKVRATAVKALKGMASELNVSRLKKLSKDTDERVRATARKVLDAMQASQ